MVLKMFSVKDAKAEIFSPPFFQTTHGLAERSFRDAVNEKGTNVNKHPQDYDLYYMGEFDDATGKFSPEPTPLHVIRAEQLLEKPALSAITQ